MVARDCIDHSRQFQCLENCRKHLRMFFKSFSDSHETIGDIIAEGDRVCIRIKGTATYKGEYQGLAPASKKITREAYTILRIADGKIAEMWTFSDELNFHKQLGIM